MPVTDEADPDEAAAGNAVSAVTRDVGPVHLLPGEESDSPPTDGVALCLSGGGYRAMMFHLGTLWRLNTAGLLPQLTRISSVSGGSITAGMLARGWKDLGFDATGVATNFAAAVAEPLSALAGITIDFRSVLLGAISPHSIADQVAAAYAEHLYGDTTLQDLPDTPIFVINATNLASGVLFRFSKRYLADWRVGMIDDPELPLAASVTASSAFPPFLAPYRLDLSGAAWTTVKGNNLATAEYRRDLHLCDGGVYDNLGIETAWKRCKTVLVSNASAHYEPQPRPADDWALETARVFSTIDAQVRSLRVRQVLESFTTGARKGIYAAIDADVTTIHDPHAFPAAPDVVHRLATTPTRLARLDTSTQQQLVNWGYAITDTRLRRRLIPALSPGTLPYPNQPLHP